MKFVLRMYNFFSQNWKPLVSVAVTVFSGAWVVHIKREKNPTRSHLMLPTNSYSCCESVLKWCPYPRVSHLDSTTIRFKMLREKKKKSKKVPKTKTWICQVPRLYTESTGMKRCSLYANIGYMQMLRILHKGSEHLRIWVSFGVPELMNPPLIPRGDWMTWHLLHFPRMWLTVRSHPAELTDFSEMNKRKPWEPVWNGACGRGKRKWARVQ